MSNQQHTPGPWFIGPEIIDNDESPDYLMVSTKDCAIASRILIDADARLIAAAPELLAALQSAMGMLKGNQETKERQERYQFALAAIAKATGAA